MKVLNLIYRITVYFLPNSVERWITSKVEVDKQKHFIICLYIALGFSILISPIVGFIAAVLIGVALEIYQKKSGTGVFDWYDILADFIGSALGAITIYLLQ